MKNYLKKVWLIFLLSLVVTAQLPVVYGQKKYPGDKTTNLHVAAYVNDFGALLQALDNGCVPAACDEAGNDALTYAHQGSKVESFLNYLSYNQYTPLRRAFYEWEVWIDYQNVCKRRSLLSGVEKGCLVGSVEVDSGLAVDEARFLCAVERSTLENVIRLLLKAPDRAKFLVKRVPKGIHYCNDDIRDLLLCLKKRGGMVLTKLYRWIVEKNKPQIINFLISLNTESRSNEILETLLYHAVSASNIELVIMLLKKGVSPNWRDYCGRTPLMIAVMCGRGIGMIHCLISYGADLRAQDSTGNTAMSLAVKFKCGGEIIAALDVGECESGDEELTSLFNGLVMNEGQRSSDYDDYEGKGSNGKEAPVAVENAPVVRCVSQVVGGVSLSPDEIREILFLGSTTDVCMLVLKLIEQDKVDKLLEHFDACSDGSFAKKLLATLQRYTSLSMRNIAVLKWIFCSGNPKVIPFAQELDVSNRVLKKCLVSVFANDPLENVVRFLLNNLSKADDLVDAIPSRLRFKDRRSSSLRSALRRMYETVQSKSKKYQTDRSLFRWVVRIHKKVKKEVVDIFISHSTESNKILERLLYYAVSGKDVDLTSMLLKKGVSPNWRDENGQTALMIAMHNRCTDNCEIISLLQEYGATGTVAGEGACEVSACDKSNDYSGEGFGIGYTVNDDLNKAIALSLIEY